VKVLAYTSPARGHLYPLVPILKELDQRGDAVAVRTVSAEVEHVRGLGFSAQAIDPRIEAIVHDDYLARTPIGGIKRVTAVLAKRAELEPDDLRSAMAEVSPDLLVIDTSCWGAAALAETTRLPWASYLPFPAPFPGKGVPPFGPGFAPAHNTLGRLRDLLLGPVTFGIVERSIKAPLNTVRKSVGASDVADAIDWFSRPPLTLYLTAEPFEYPRTDWPASFRLVGPIGYDPPAPAPEWLAAVDRPLVLVTTSSEFQNDVTLIANALAGLRDADVFVVGTLPSGNPRDFDVPTNARLERFLPHSVVLAKASCVVTHGGMGATQKALAAGVPVVVVPFGRDQLEIARRVELSGAGVRLPRAKLSPQRLRDAVLDAQHRAPAAQQLAHTLAAAGGAPRAVDELQALAQKTPPPAASDT
jgi:MGT family glycosyltransferase